MTPKEKAEDLFQKMFSSSRNIEVEQSKKCALICVDEIMDTIPSLDECKSLYIFWSHVKHELNKQD